MLIKAGQVLNDFLALFYPNYCLSCETTLVKGERIICSRCLLELPQTNFHRDSRNELFRRLEYQQTIKNAVALFKFGKGGGVQHLLHSLKYKNHPEIGFLLGLYYGDKLQREWKDHQIEALIPIPLHVSKLRRRGYNQSEEFAKGLSESLKIEINSNALRRRVFTETQTRKDKLDRWENVKDVFVVRDKLFFRDRRVALVDDVVTTGSTIEAAAMALLESGCADINVISLAYAGK